jgi:hypothetical protein
MLGLEELRKIDDANQLSDKELLELRDALHPILEKILDRYFATADATQADLHT